jgi:mRNA-degrading endonuclease RelE of RelBE toxin-antitoxin system
MNFNVLITKPFERKLKQLAKKYPSIATDLDKLEKELSQNPNMGISLGKNCYKIRMAISSKAKGKSGGARIITYLRIIKNTVYLIDIYDKSEQVAISDNELMMIIETLSD